MILHYIAVYDGSYKRIRENIEQDIICAFPIKERQKHINAIDVAFNQPVFHIKPPNRTNP